MNPYIRGGGGAHGRASPPPRSGTSMRAALAISECGVQRFNRERGERVEAEPHLSGAAGSKHRRADSPRGDAQRRRRPGQILRSDALYASGNLV